MSELIALRRHLYRHFAETGEPPPLDPDELQSLAAAHAVVLGEHGDIVFANPFAVGETDCEVRVDDRTYSAVCIWDALGIVAATGAEGTVRTACPCCATPLSVGVRRGEVAGDGVVHFLLPAREWYADLAFT